MKYAAFLALITLAACFQHAPTRPLPHRAEWEVNHGQGRNPALGHCPTGTREYFLYTDEGVPFFLECMR